ncbi:unnamed protein product [Clavelina lepadiformis]|uniref:Histone-lysine N-methyltransferase SETDB1 n=1 Tax=Clavelina lepadiformis TaxID=159417 RepID=A0ABP0GV02_CLALP
MEKMDLKEMLGSKLEDMVHSVFTDELKKLAFSEESNASSYDKLSKSVDDNVVNKLPVMHKLFEELDKDVTKLEQQSYQFTDELNTLLVNEAEDGTTNKETAEVVSREEVLMQKETNIPEAGQQNLEDMFKYVRNGKIDSDVLQAGKPVLAFCKNEWKKAAIIDKQRHREKQKYKVRFEETNHKSLLQANHLACLETYSLFRPGQIPAGSRVAANYRDEGLYSGIVAEAEDKAVNRGRFLVFFDDGYAMYCFPKNVYLTYGPQINVWNEISHRDTAQYIKEYLSTPERQMLSVKEGQTLKVEFDGEWHKARCLKVDCSLVEILYFSDNSREWIYRGSMRLEPLYRQQHMKIHPEKSNQIARAHTGIRRAHIEIVDLTGDQTENVEPEGISPSKKEGQWEAPWSRRLSDQKSSTNQTAPTKIPDSFTEMNGGFDMASRIFSRFERRSKSVESEIDMPSTTRMSSKSKLSQKLSEDPDKSGIIDDGIDEDLLPQNISKISPPYTLHTCSPHCVAAFTWKTKSLAGANPLIKPLLRGWTRDVCRLKIGSLQRIFHHVYYRAPCGRSCRNMNDVERYLFECNINELDYDHFCFDHTVRTVIGNPAKAGCVITKPPRDAKYFNPDYSGGKEDMPVSCVNEIGSEEPPRMPYTKMRKPGTGVKINRSPNFMVCCDCPDNCRDRSKCPCQQLTVQATSCCRGGKTKKQAGYQHKRLFSFLPTGIYECNDRCKCNQQCKNRVVQKGLQCRLQMFKTQKKGWGIRCLDDIARGTFVCIYTGMIQTEVNANEEGLQNGDEYLAELDHIEVAESQKEEYDSANSSGVDMQSDFSDDGGSSDKAEQARYSTDTDDDDSEIAEKKLDALLGGQQRKLGYSAEVSPPNLPENIHKRRGKMVMKKLVSENKNSSFQQLQDDDTTDTDSDGEIITRPVARKSTGGNKVGVDLDSDEETIGTRKYFGPQGTFIINAKKTGNLGRYLNHSCTPNLMVQNVFIDTHDLRFPWVAFFASSTIRSGMELTWDYNYVVGSIPDRVIHCFCGSTKCRKRLL